MVGDKRRAQVTETIKNAGNVLGKSIGLANAIGGLTLAIALLTLVIVVKILKAGA